MKVAINSNFGGFSLSYEAMEYMASKGSVPAREGLEEASREFPNSSMMASYYEFTPRDCRTDPILISAIETLGPRKAGGRYAELKIVEIPDGISWYIEDYDGRETIHEDHRIWC